MEPTERNAFIAAKLTDFFERVQAGEGPAPDRYPSERKVLERLIPIQTDGFRGITLTAIMGKMIRADINTGTEFNSIKPRAIFENAIYGVLKSYRVPTGFSPPLNVAKNVQVLDEKWAEGRKPEDAAMAAVDYVRRINSHWHDEAFRDDLVMMFVQRLLAYATEVGSHDIELPPLGDIPPVSMAIRLARFAIKFPEGGSVPQFVIGTLLRLMRANDPSFAGVEGVEASVFGTNTTSGKPADIWDRMADGSLGNLYEVTCKPIDLGRLDAAVEAFAKLGIPNTPVTFVCRLPGDAAELNLIDGAIVYRGMTFQFVDISSQIADIFLLLPKPKREEAISLIASFVSEPSRKIKTKQGWSKALSNL